jgi:hypothetical protein
MSKKARSNKMLHESPKKVSKTVRQKMFLEAYVRCRFVISAACGELGVSRKQVYEWLKEPKFSEDFYDCLEARKDQIEAALFSRIEDGDTASIIFSAKTLCKDRGYVEHERQRGPEPLPPAAISIIDRVLSDDLDAASAGLELAKLGVPIPEALKLMISKQDITPPPDISFNLEEFEIDAERRYQEALAGQDKEETEFVPQRQEEVKRIKDELKDFDSFSPEATGNDGKKQP